LEIKWVVRLVKMYAWVGGLEWQRTRLGASWAGG
jgi:hypothetical protein